MPNFCSLAGLEVAEKFVVVVVGWWGHGWKKYKLSKILTILVIDCLNFPFRTNGDVIDAMLKKKSKLGIY